MSIYRFPKEIRETIKNALPKDTVYGQEPELRYIYVPVGHARALHPDGMLVVGMRGAGKSFWWKSLQNPNYRRMVAHILPKSEISERTVISVGFGERPSPDDYPGKDTLIQLSESFEPRHIWMTVLLGQLTKNTDSTPWTNRASWKEKVQWMVNNPEKVERAFFEVDKQLEQADTYHLCLFDALDRSADDWPTLIKLIRGLLQILLEFRFYKRIRPKAFVRPDHIEDPKTADFPDSSKVLTQKVELRWPKLELFGLLWQHLANEPNQGVVFRDNCKQLLGISWAEFNEVWLIPERLRVEEEAQRAVFHAITGPWMGRDRRRGFPYSWLPNHLGDAGGQVSPRSFLAALRHAAEDQGHSAYEYPLYYESIKRGVQEASRIRVREMQEDYPWVERLMKPLAGVTVPCRFDEIEDRWEKERVREYLEKNLEVDSDAKLPPAHLKEGLVGVRRDLEALGVFERMLDDRVNLPDVYRVGYGLGRRGGVKAVARQ